MSAAAGTRQGQRIFGIDLGTTNSGIALWDEAAGRPEMLPLRDGSYLLPSLVAWDADGRRWLVGPEAEALRTVAPRRAAFSVKRFIGRRFAEPGVLHGRRHLPFGLVAGDGKDPLRDVVIDFGAGAAGGPTLSAPEVSARVLARLREDAAARLGLPPSELGHAVIAVPAYFNNHQRKATILAGRLAGWEVVDILDEPTAAALAYGDTVLGERERRIVVFDLGGGTLDVSLLETSRDAVGFTCFHTKVVDGDTCLGGDDIDLSVARRLAAEVERRRGRGVRADDHAAWDRLRRAAEKAKVALSGVDAAEVDLAGTDLAGWDGVGATPPLTRVQLEECAADVRRRAGVVLRRAAEEVAGLSWEHIDEVILVGGQTLMPAVQRDVRELTGRPPRVNDRPQYAVALGAAVYGHILSLGRERFHENTLINVIALALGIRLDDNTFAVLVPANATVPSRSAPFAVTTTEDNQKSIHVEVLQGPRGATRADQCVVLGGIDMEVPPAPARQPRFEVEFEVHSDGTLKVAVTDTRRDRRAEADIVENRVLAWRDRAETPEPGPAD